MRHILLVEDNAADVLLVREAIRKRPIDADVIIAYDGEQALHFLKEFNFKPDLIVLDLNIPKFNGLEILERSRGEGRPPVLVLTSSVNSMDRERALELGAREYMIKPLPFDGFITTVGNAIERWIVRRSATPVSRLRRQITRDRPRLRNRKILRALGGHSLRQP